MDGVCCRKGFALKTLLLCLVFTSTCFSFSFMPHYRVLSRARKHNVRMDADSYSLVVLGDLHLDPGDMQSHVVGREQIKQLTALERNQWIGNFHFNWHSMQVTLGLMGVQELQKTLSSQKSSWLALAALLIL
ncbi:unnamed protein product [Heterosigma akashiwo]